MALRSNSSWNLSDPLLRMYIQDTKKYRLLSRDEEREIGSRILAKDPEACNKLVTSNLLFVVFMAKRFAYYDEGLMDYISEGNFGLMTAASRFDVDLGYKFSTLGTWDIRQKMQRMRNLAKIVSIPKKKMAMRRHLESKIDSFEKEHCRLPSIAEISELVAMPEKKVAQGLEYHGWTVSIDSSETEVDYRNELADESDNAEQKLVKGSNLVQVRNIVATLPRKEAMILTYAYGLDGEDQKTAAEIAALMGYSKERIRQLKYNAEKKIKERLKKFIDPKGHNFL